MRLLVLPLCAFAAFAQPIRQFNDQVVKLVEKTSPAVVLVTSNAYGPVSGDADGAVVALQQSSGSGVIVSPDGYVVTNRHVVSGATRV